MSLRSQPAITNRRWTHPLAAPQLRGSPHAVLEYERIRAIVEAHPVLGKRDQPFLVRLTLFVSVHCRAAAAHVTWCPASSAAACAQGDHGARYRRGLAKSRAVNDLRVELGWTREQFTLALEAVADDVPTAVHETVFIPCLKTQCSDEQLAHWLPQALEYKIIGAYAQTELGHGSNIRGLETVATYLPDTDEFDLHSPTLTSTKWWIGGLGKVRACGRRFPTRPPPHMRPQRATVTVYRQITRTRVALGGRSRPPRAVTRSRVHVCDA